MIPENMVRVTKDAFHATAGQLNVHPSPQGRYDNQWGYRTEWRMCDSSRKLIGLSIGGTHLQRKQYFVTPEFHAANKSAIEEAGGNMMHADCYREEGQP